MSFNTMAAEMQDILNRDDCTSSLATTFLTQSISRIQRTARLPCMERQQLITPTEALDWVPIPGDFLQMIDVFVPDQWGGIQPLKHLPYRRMVRMNPLLWPTAYGREQSQIWFRGRVQEGQLVQMLYYGQFTPFATPDSDNELSLSSPDLVVYGALSFAGDHFQHPNTAQWEGRYNQILGEVQQMSADVDMEGGPMQVESMARDASCWEDYYA